MPNADQRHSLEVPQAQDIRDPLVMKQDQVGRRCRGRRQPCSLSMVAADA